MKAVYTVKKIVKFIDETAFSVFATALVFLAFIAVIFRFIINDPITWAEEVEMILIVWSVFFGASAAFREKGHLVVDLLYDRFPVKLRKFADVIIWLFTVFCLTVLTVIEWQRVETLIESNLTTPLLKIPMKFEFAVVVFACVCMLINLIINAIEAIAKLKKGETAQ